LDGVMLLPRSAGLTPAPSAVRARPGGASAGNAVSSMADALIRGGVC
jgi:hypothetical protein